MNLKKLTKRLRREATASPKKAAVLGLLALAAMYFWIPLLKGMVVQKDVLFAERTTTDDVDAASNVVVRSANKTLPTDPRSNLPGGAAPQEPTWEATVALLEEDERARPAESLVARRNPFARLDGEPPETAPDLEEAEPVEPVEPVLTPESLGIELTGTVVGPGRRVAVIDGKAYSQGRIVALAKNGETVRFTLAEVHAERIVLERADRRFELAIPRRPASRQAGSIRMQD